MYSGAAQPVNRNPIRVAPLVCGRYPFEVLRLARRGGARMLKSDSSYLSLEQLPKGRAVLVVAHPGHELRVHGWLEAAKPVVFVLTDGSGGAGEPRLERTRQLLIRVGATPGGLFGRFSDRAIYQAILNGEFELFTSLIDELTEEIAGQGSAYLVGDATEGYNPTHDVCRLMIDAAVAILRVKTGRLLPNFAFPLTGAPTVVPPSCATEPLRIDLDAEAYQRKLQAAKHYEPLHDEVEKANQAAGERAFQLECLFPALPGSKTIMPTAEKPFYEKFGEGQVRAGRYQQVLEYRRHFLPLAEAVERYVQAAT